MHQKCEMICLLSLLLPIQFSHFQLCDKIVVALNLFAIFYQFLHFFMPSFLYFFSVQLLLFQLLQNRQLLLFLTHKVIAKNKENFVLSPLRARKSKNLVKLHFGFTNIIFTSCNPSQKVHPRGKFQSHLFSKCLLSKEIKNVR